MICSEFIHKTFFTFHFEFHLGSFNRIFNFIKCHQPLLKSDLNMPKPGYYAVKNGRNPGIYSTWMECELQVKGYPNAVYKKFSSRNEAESYVGHQSLSIQPINSFPINSNRKTTSIVPTNNVQRFPQTSSASPVILSEEDLIDSATLIELLYPDTKTRKGPFYAVHRGVRPGVYKTWTECEAQIKDTKNASYRKFDNEEEALEYVRTGGITKATKREIREIQYNNRVKKRKIDNDGENLYILEDPNEPVVIFTDGASAQNGKKRARAGIGVYWGPNHPMNTSKRLPGRQTNNRAEIHAAIHALHQAKEIGALRVKLYTDSQFLIHSITDWIKKWKSNGWKLVNGDAVVNKDDFIELESAAEGIDVEWVYVRAHNQNHGNDEADRLAVAGAQLLLEPTNCSKYANVGNNVISASDVKPFLVGNTERPQEEIMSLIIPEERIERKSYYAVYRGEAPGVYSTWVECNAQIENYYKPVYRKFTTEQEARDFVKSGKMPKKVFKIPDQGPDDYISVFTDGASSNNGKPEAAAGIGVYWGPGNELNTSMRLPGPQTNNRAEIHAAVHALRQSKYLGIKNVRLYTDSKYVINGITSWINTWKKNNWKSSSGKPVSNKEDFMALDYARQELNVDWCYVKGHDNNPGNVEADKLAVAGCTKSLSETITLG